MKHQKFLVASVASLLFGVVVGIFLVPDIVPALSDGALIPLSIVTTLATAFGVTGTVMVVGEKALVALATWRESRRIKKSRRIFRVI